jgi:DNA helicase-4
VLYKSNGNVDEISYELTKVRKNRKYCPKCGYPLQLQYNKAYGLKLYICSNEPEICDFMTNDIRGNGNVHLCDKCNGYMMVKETKKTNKFFFGCTNYKKDGTGCNNTEELTIE